MKRRMAILKTIAVGAVALALAGGALGSDISVRVAGANAANSDSASAAEHTTVNAGLSTVAANIVATLTGGEKPTTMAKHDEISAQINAKPKGGEKADKAKDEPEANDNDVDENEDVDKDDNDADNDNDEHGQKPGDTGTAGTKPGFGCGDKNHEHSGPPGNPGASMPKGCENHDNHGNDKDKHKSNKH